MLTVMGTFSSVTDNTFDVVGINAATKKKAFGVFVVGTFYP